MNRGATHAVAGRQGWRRAAPPAVLLLAEGFASLGCELLALRKLIPVSGAGLQTNSVLIGCWLTLLAYGYWRGGRNLAASRDERSRVLLCFAAAAIVGLGALGLDMFQLTSRWGLPTWAALAACSLAAGAIARYCGEIVARIPRCGWPGWTTSRVLFFSTLGSALAALAIPLALMPFLGLSLTIVLLLALLAAAAFATGPGVDYGRGLRLAAVAAAVLAAVYAAWSNPFFLARTAYADYSTYASPDESEKGKTGLAVNNSLASWHRRTGRGTATSSGWSAGCASRGAPQASW